MKQNTHYNDDANDDNRINIMPKTWQFPAATAATEAKAAAANNN